MPGECRPRSGAAGGIEAVAASWIIRRRGRRIRLRGAWSCGPVQVLSAARGWEAGPRERPLRAERGTVRAVRCRAAVPP